MIKKIGLLVILLLVLIRCQNEVTTFDEIIKNDKVDTDGIIYDIKSIREISYEYDKTGQMIRRYSNYDDQEQHTEFIYNHNLLVEERYSYDVLSSMIYYTYKEGRKVKTEIKYKSEFSFVTLHTYDGQNRKIEILDETDEVNHYNEGLADEQENLLKWTS